jgi:hypothetical protein
MKQLTKIGSRLLLAIIVTGVPATVFASSLSVPGTRSAANNTLNNQARNGNIAPESSMGEDEHGKRSYRLVPIDIKGAINVNAFEINTRRIASGAYDDPTGKLHGFIWFQGQVITIDKPDAEITAVGAITDNGLLFGNWGSSSEQHAGYYDLATATWTQLPDLPGYPLNIGNRMNDHGDAVGYACRSATFAIPADCDAWSWDGQSYTVYHYPEAINTFAYGINNRGKEVGRWEKLQNVYLGYVRECGRIEDLILSIRAGVFRPTAYDINDNGDILAAAPLDPDPNAFWPSFIMRGEHSITRLPNYPGVLRTFYQGMNEREDLVGIWFNDPSASPIHGFVAFRERRGDCDAGRESQSNGKDRKDCND